MTSKTDIGVCVLFLAASEHLQAIKDSFLHCSSVNRSTIHSETRRNVMKSDNTSKSKKKMRLWKEITNLSAPKNTHTDFELTAAIGKVASNTQPNRKSSLRRRRVKCEEQKHVNLLRPKRIGVAGKRRHPSEMTNVTRQLIFGDDDDTHRTPRGAQRSLCVCVCDRKTDIHME